MTPPRPTFEARFFLSSGVDTRLTQFEAAEIQLWLGLVLRNSS